MFVWNKISTQSYSANFLYWGDHVNSVPDLAASPPWGQCTFDLWTMKGTKKEISDMFWSSLSSLHFNPPPSAHHKHTHILEQEVLDHMNSHSQSPLLPSPITFPPYRVRGASTPPSPPQAHIYILEQEVLDHMNSHSQRPHLPSPITSTPPLYRVGGRRKKASWTLPVAASAPVAERFVKLKGLVTHRFHKAQVYCVNCYSDPVW